MQPARTFDLRQDGFGVVRRSLANGVFADALQFEGDEFLLFFRVLLVAPVEVLQRQGQRLGEVNVQLGMFRLMGVKLDGNCLT